MPELKQRAIGLYNWFEMRLGLGAPAIEAAEHEVPENTSSWWYVFGSAATVILGLQILTGILLALVYTPSYPASPLPVSSPRYCDPDPCAGSHTSSPPPPSPGLP